jgi:hypothetical protein
MQILYTLQVRQVLPTNTDQKLEAGNAQFHTEGTRQLPRANLAFAPQQI